jgi:uncharacterized membrane protein
MNRNYSVWLLLAAFILVFGYFGIDKFVHPLLWTGYLPLWMHGLLGMDKNIWIKIVGASEIGMALLLLIPHIYARLAGTIFVILHLAAVLVQVGWNDIGVRDIGLMLAAGALLVLLWNDWKKA